MKYLILYLIFFICIANSTAQQVLPADALASAYTGFAKSGPSSIFQNQAGLSNINGLNLVASANQRYFSDGILELGIGGAFSIAENMGMSVFAKRFGDDIYSEQSAGFGIGRKLFDNLSLGLAMEFHQVSIENYGVQSGFNAQLGAITEINKSVHIGAHVYIPFQPDENLTTLNQGTFNLDIEIKASKKLIISAGARKQTDRELGVKTALDYHPSEKFSVQVGFLTNPQLLTTGLSFEFSKEISLQYAGTFHTALGWSSGLSFVYQKS